MAKLKEKLQEEVEEFMKSEEQDELVDLLEIIYAVGEAKGWTRKELEELRAKKAEERGGFKKKIILEES